MKKIQEVIEVNPKYMATGLPDLNRRLGDGWLVKKVIVCHENCVHYLIEKEVPDDRTEE